MYRFTGELKFTYVMNFSDPEFHKLEADPKLLHEVRDKITFAMVLGLFERVTGRSLSELKSFVESCRVGDFQWEKCLNYGDPKELQEKFNAEFNKIPDSMEKIRNDIGIRCEKVLVEKE
jgi:hypothetical protein